MTDKKSISTNSGRPINRRPINGPPTKFTTATIKKILGCIRDGMSLAMSARAARISPESLWLWRKKYPDFEGAVERAIANGANANLRKIKKAAAEGDWRAAAWLLEHTLPQHFAKSRVEVTGEGGAPLGVGIAIYLPAKNGTTPGPGTKIIDMPESLQLPERSSDEKSA